MSEVRISLPVLHPGQRAIDNQARRFNVASMGRRWGKTKYGVQRLLSGEKSILDGYPAGWFAPSSRYIDEVWLEICRRCRPIISKTNKSSMRIEFITGASLDFWAMGENPEVARGRRYSRVIIDEAAHIRYLKDAWERAVSPTLTDFQGEAWFISTPNGLNYFHELWQRGGNDAFPEWQHFQLPTLTNPYIEPGEVLSKQSELPALVYKQEYEAQFVTFGGGLVKPEMIERQDIPRGTLPVAIGVDLAISTKEGADFTAIAVVGINKDSGMVHVFDVVRGRFTFHQAQQEIKRIAALYNPVLIAIESVQYQSAIVQELLRTTALPVRGIRPDKDKITRFQPLLTRYEQGFVRHDPNLPNWFTEELLSFPDGEHDDCVDALVYAWNAATKLESRPVVGGNKRVF